MLALVHPLQQQLPTPPRPTSSVRPPRTAPPRKVHSAPPRPSAVAPVPRPHPRHPPPTPPPAPPPLDIHSYPSTELLRLLASLLTQIAATNDALAAPLTDPPSNVPSRTSLSSVTESDAPIWRTLTTAARTSISTPSSTLTFHARNVPTISLEAYLLRILKYCPTTNEVFLSLLVYFDRMSKLTAEATGRTFVIDSFNIHRLVIAGVTVASKFFSDVFYTNSRYAKVGGLPLAELNQLELQFLLLNDFRLVIPGSEMQRYAEQLILFSADGDASAVPVPVHSPMRMSADDSDTTDTDAGDTDAGETTDDEPTIRPAYSSTGSRGSVRSFSTDDSQSVHSVDVDIDDADAGAGADDAGARTPERAPGLSGDRTPDRRSTRVRH